MEIREVDQCSQIQSFNKRGPDPVAVANVPTAAISIPEDVTGH
jgi:hypothetical protein